MRPTNMDDPIVTGLSGANHLMLHSSDMMLQPYPYRKIPNITKELQAMTKITFKKERILFSMNVKEPL